MPELRHAHVGGSFAPPLSDDLLAKYETMLADLDPQTQLADAFGKVLECCKQWWAIDDSSGASTRPHPTGLGTITDLDEPIKAALWDSIPWEDELVSISNVFEAIPADSQKDLRNAAFHLLWHVRELNLDREPITADKVLAK